LVAEITSFQHHRVPAGLLGSSSSTSSDQVAFVAFLFPSPLRRPRLSWGAKVPANGACRPGVLIAVAAPLLSNRVNWPAQLSKLPP
jgi:hypothetical protein